LTNKLAGFNTLLGIGGIALALFLAKDVLKIEEKIEDIRGRVNL